MFFIGEAKVGVKLIRAYAERMRSENVIRGILVVRQQLTPSSKQWVQDFNTKFHMEVFRVSSIVFPFDCVWCRLVIGNSNWLVVGDICFFLSLVSKFRFDVAFFRKLLKQIGFCVCYIPMRLSCGLEMFE